LLTHRTESAFRLAEANAGINSAAKTPITANATTSSTNVKEALLEHWPLSDSIYVTALVAIIGPSPLNNANLAVPTIPEKFYHLPYWDILLPKGDMSGLLLVSLRSSRRICDGLAP